MMETGFKPSELNFGPNYINQLWYGLLMITDCFESFFKIMTKIYTFSFSH